MVVRAGGVTLLVDSGPDLRQQALREGLLEINAVIYTHSHLDHVVGFDELRAFCWNKNERLPLHAGPQCMATLETMFGWAFDPAQNAPGYVRPVANIIHEPFSFGDLLVTPLRVEHATVETMGFLFEFPGAKRIAYIPDVKRIPENTIRLIEGIDIFVVDALRMKAHPTHFSVDEALAVSSRINAREIWLTHLSHEHDSTTGEQQLPKHVHLAWDGLTICA